MNIIWISVIGAVALVTLVFVMMFIADWVMTRLTIWYCRRKKIIIDEDYHPASNDWTVCVFDISGPSDKHKTHGVIINTSCEGIYFLTKYEARVHGAKEAREYLKTKR